MCSSFRRLTSLPTVLMFCLYLEALAKAPDCTKARQEWMQLWYMSNLGNTLDSVPWGSEGINICPVPTGFSCCNQQMEQNMLVFGRSHLMNRASLHLLAIAEQMSNDSAALQHFFLSDLERSQDRLHQFFSRIYGYNYKLHRRFFFQFFTDLKAYVTGERGQLDHLIDNFFNQLRDSIVTLIERSGQMHMSSSFHGPNDGSTDSSGSSISGNVFSPIGSNPDFDDTAPNEAGETRRIRCLSERMAQLKPFDDVDVRLKARVMEAYPPARMLVNVLSVTGRLLIHLLKQVGDRPECIIGMTRFRFCAICAGITTASTCPESCDRLLSSCFTVTGSENIELKVVWPRLIDSIVVAATRLERSFNFPAVNRHLQMDISEAITSLQTRYEQTKSKFQSECRMGFSGRNVPALFSSTGSSNRLSHSNGQSASLPAWPPNTGRFRGKLVVDSHRLRRSAASLASPELLDWQTRLRLSTVNPTNFGLRSLDYDTTGSPHAYNRPVDGYRIDSNRGVSPDKLVDPPEHLMRWAAQLKRSYSSLSTLFVSPGAHLCSASRTHQAVININSTTECWNPPELPKPQPDQGIKETIQLLSLAAERLQLASSNSGDPETVTLRLPTIEQLPVDPRVASMQSTASPSETFRSQGDPHFSPESQWDMDRPSGPYSAAEPRFEQDEPLGSGVGLPPAVRANLDDSESRRIASNTEQPPHTSFGPIGDRPGDTSNVNQWSINTSSNFGDAEDVGYKEPTVTREMLKPTTEIAVAPVTSSFPHAASVITTTVAATTETVATTIEGTTAVALTATVTVASPELLPAGTSDTSPPKLSSSLTVYPREDIDASSTTPVHEPNWHLSLPGAQQPVYSGLPDDEDSIRRPGADVFPHQSTTSSPSWSGGAQPNLHRGHWWEDTYVEGSGFPTPSRMPVNKPGFESPPEKLNRPDTGTPPFFSSGSGLLSFHSALERPPNILPAPPETTFENPNQRWPHPTLQDSVTPHTEWTDIESDKNIEHTSGWQGNFLGSGIPDPAGSLPTHAQPSPLTSTSQPLINPTIVKTESPAYPPLPPPEVWVPAQIGPGQPPSPLLLVREYNLQGPLYGSESATLHMDGGASPRNTYGLKELLPAALHCLLYVLL